MLLDYEQLGNFERSTDWELRNQANRWVRNKGNVKFVQLYKNQRDFSNLFFNNLEMWVLMSDRLEAQDTAWGSLSKPRRRQQRERHKTKDLMSKTIATHVRYKSLYISFSKTATWNDQVLRNLRWTRMKKWLWNVPSYFVPFFSLHLGLNAIIAYLAWARFGAILAHQTDLDYCLFRW